MLRFCVRYSRPQDLVADFEAQFQKGGLLVRVEAPEGLSRLDAVELAVESPFGTAVLPAQVVQIIPGAGVALALDATDTGLVAAVEEASGAGPGAGDPPVHTVLSGDAAGSEPRGGETEAGERAPPGKPAAAGGAGGVAQKIHLALHGKKEARQRIMREGDRKLHHYVLRNPGLRLDEVTSIAKMSTVSPDLLKAIAERREWVGRPEIALALVRNPKTPVPLAIRLLNNISNAELRRLAKGTSVRMQILQAARKMVVG